MRTYLGSVEWFHKFLKLEKKLTEEQLKEINILAEQMKTWRSPLNRKYESSHEIKKRKNIKIFPSSKEFEAIEKAPHSREAQSLLKSFKREAREIDMHSFCHARDYLLVNMGSDNATRSGASIYMTLEEYEDRQFDKDGVTVTVFNHKMSHKHPVDISLPSKLADELHIYVKKSTSAFDWDRDQTTQQSHYNIPG